MTFHSCDRGFGGQDCVSMEPHPMNLVVHFDEGAEAVLFGGNVSTACGVLQSGSAAVFHQVIKLNLSIINLIPYN